MTNSPRTVRMEISVYPVGTGSVSFLRELSVIFEVLDASGLQYEVSVMGTIVEGTLDELFALGRKIHDAVFSQGPERIVTLIKIDERRDHIVS